MQGFPSSGAAVASIAGLLLGGFLYEHLSASIFIVSGVVTALAMLASFAVAPPEPA